MAVGTYCSLCLPSFLLPFLITLEFSGNSAVISLHSGIFPGTEHAVHICNVFNRNQHLPISLQQFWEQALNEMLNPKYINLLHPMAFALQMPQAAVRKKEKRSDSVTRTRFLLPFILNIPVINRCEYEYVNMSICIQIQLMQFPPSSSKMLKP